LPCASPDCGQVNRPFSNLLGTDPESASVPDENLQPIALGVAEQEEVPAQRLTRQSVSNQTVQPLEPLAHVGDPGGQIDPCGWTQAKHGLRPPQQIHQALERTRIKIGMYLDPAAARQHHGQPTTRFVLLRRFPGRQLHRHQLAGRRNWPTPSLPTPFLQMAIQRAEARSSNPDSGKTRSAAYRCSQTRQPTAELRHGYVASALTTLFLRSSGHFNTDPRLSNRCVGQTLTIVIAIYAPS